MTEFKEILAQVSGNRAACFEREIIADGRPFVVKRRFLPPQRLILLGAGHVARPVCEMAHMVGFDVTVVDDRPSFADAAYFPGAKEILCDSFEHAIGALHISSQDYIAVVTRGHRHDAVCIRAVYAACGEPFYIGLMGSKRRVSCLFALLRDEGIAQSFLDRVHTPIGLSIGAVTPEEIAVSIVSELVLCRRQGASSGGSGFLAQEDTDFALLAYMADPQEDAACAVVIGTDGSSPVKSGAMMAVNRAGRVWGTVGGGSGEYAVMRRALEVIETGAPCVYEADMTEDAAEPEGMACGGRMKVYIFRLEE